MIDFSKVFQLKGLKPKNKGQTNFYECCDLTKKVYLTKVAHLVQVQDFTKGFFPCAGQFPITSERKVLFGAAGSDDPGPLLLLKQRFLSSWAFFFKGQTLNSFHL